MFFKNCKTKFQYQAGCINYLKLVFLIAITLPSLALFQVVLSSASKEKLELLSAEKIRNSTHLSGDFNREPADIRYVHVDSSLTDASILGDSEINQYEQDLENNKPIFRIKRTSNLEEFPNEPIDGAQHHFEATSLPDQLSPREDVSDQLNDDNNDTNNTSEPNRTRELRLPLNHEEIKASEHDDNLLSLTNETSLADIAAVGTAAGLVLSDLVAQRTAPEEALNTHGTEQGVDNGRQRVIDGQQSVPDTYKFQSLDGSIDIADQMPDSIESLMGADQTDLADGGDRNDQSASNRVENEDVNSHTPEASSLVNKNGDEELEAYPQPDQMNSDSLSTNNQLIHSTRPALRTPASRARSELASSERYTQMDLNTAAGHHYGKKKKKKKVKKVKKIKKIVIKKKKKIKYKKKKVVKYKKHKKVKKPKKMHHDHGKYYMYAKVPKKKSWEFGFKKGNKKHWIERHEKGHKSKFKTKVKWYDKKSKGKGVHIWDYNHHDKKKKKHYG